MHIIRSIDWIGHIDEVQNIFKNYVLFKGIILDLPLPIEFGHLKTKYVDNHNHIITGTITQSSEMTWLLPDLYVVATLTQLQLSPLITNVELFISDDYREFREKYKKSAEEATRRSEEATRRSEEATRRSELQVKKVMKNVDGKMNHLWKKCWIFIKSSDISNED